MSKAQKPQDPLQFDPQEGLDDDVGGDWESAFQAEDFMLSSDEEGEAFHDLDEGDDINLASLLEEANNTTSAPASSAAQPSPAQDAPQTDDTGPIRKGPLGLLTALPSVALAWYQARPRYQKFLFPSLPLLAILLIASLLFFRSTSNELSQMQAIGPTPDVPDTALQPPPAPLADKEAVTLPDTEQNVAPITPAAGISGEQTGKNRKKWRLPGFLITVPEEGSTRSAMVSVDLTLILLLEPGQPIPEQKRAYVRDTIYQFYRNRPAEELRRYALARGEMIRSLESWLRKAWPEAPLASIIFDQYRVVL